MIVPDLSQIMASRRQGSLRRRLCATNNRRRKSWWWSGLMLNPTGADCYYCATPAILIRFDVAVRAACIDPVLRSIAPDRNPRQELGGRGVSDGDRGNGAGNPTGAPNRFRRFRIWIRTTPEGDFKVAANETEAGSRGCALPAPPPRSCHTS